MSTSAERDQADHEEDLPSSVPTDFVVCTRGFADRAREKQLGELVWLYVREIGKAMDLSRLDGVTVANDYNQALLDLDRGYETTHRLTPSEGEVVGVAMTPTVIRDGVIKSHIVYNAHYLTGLDDLAHQFYGGALHTVAHECAHVEVTSRFDIAFPGQLLRQQYADLRLACRGQIIRASWDEYGATRRSAFYGADPGGGYEHTLLLQAREARSKANDLIKAFRVHGRIDELLAAVYGVYGDLIKFSAYFLGNLAGRDRSINDAPAIAEGLAGHWFEPLLRELESDLQKIWDDYGTWRNQQCFERIGDLADRALALGGVLYKNRANGVLYIDIPLSAETLPDDDTA
jgi:hypothetical protein